MTKLTKINKFHWISKCLLKFHRCLEITIKTQRLKMFWIKEKETCLSLRNEILPELKIQQPHHSLRPFVYRDRARSRRKGGQYFSADRSSPLDTSSAYSLPVRSLLLLLQNTTWYFTSVSMLYILSFFFF